MVNDNNNARLFEDGVTAPALRYEAVSLSPNEPERWVEVRDAHTQPRYVSSYAGSEQYRAEFLEGCRLMGLGSAKKPVHSQQLVLADAANAVDEYGVPLARFLGVLLPRRSSKTTTILALALGRCLAREEYYVAFTLATTGLMARRRFKADIVPALERAYPDEDTRPFRIYKGGGSEAVYFDNGSRFLVVPPSSESFRSEAFDLIVVDESGAATPDMGEDLLTGLLPTLDTRPDAQVIFAGTAADYRKGNLLWDALEDGRNGAHRAGLVEYSAPDTLTAEDVAEWEQVAPLVLAHHPGVGTLTTLDALEFNFHKLPRTQFLQEYLSVFGTVGQTTGLVKPEKWAAAEQSGMLPEPPKHFALAISAAPNQSTASIVAAWRESGMACLLELEHRDGVGWLADRALELARKYGVPIVHDNFGVVLAEVESLHHVKPRPRLAPQSTRNTTTAAALLVREVEDGNVRHWGQGRFTASVLAARKRKIGANGWGFGRAELDDDITSIEAAAMALRHYDEKPQRERVGLIIAA